MKGIVLVTGGSSGIGRSIAGHLSSIGYTVYGTSRSVDNGQVLDNFTLVKLDVTDEETIGQALSYIHDKHGKLDVLINNAGLGMAGPLESTTYAEALEIYQTNVFGVLNVCRQAIPLLRKSEAAYLINITSIAGRVALPFRGIYCSSKFAVEGLTEALSMELKSSGIRVSIVEPGDFKTNINQNRRITGTGDSEVYNGAFERTLDKIKEEVNTARDPKVIAETVARILRSRKPKLRYIVGTPVQRLSIRLKNMLPARAFERMLMGHYDLD